MADITFNTKEGQTVDRALLILYLNVKTADEPEWAQVGKRVEESSAEYDWGEESKTDIFGNTYTSLKKPVITQSFDPCELDSGDKAQMKIWNAAIKDHDTAALTNMDMMIVHLYAGASEDDAFAERYTACCVKPTGLGGSGGGNLGMPIDVTYGGNRVTGTAKVADGNVTFTPSAE